MNPAFSIWFARHGAGIDEATARKVWNAAISESYAISLEVALAHEVKHQNARNFLDSDHAKAKFYGAREVGSQVFELKA